MNPMTVNQQSTTPPFEKTTRFAKAFHISANAADHCFILTTQETSTIDEVVQDKHHVLFIHGESKQLYEYVLFEEADTVLNDLMQMLNQQSDQDCFNVLLKHGFGRVSKDPISIETQLFLHGLGNIQTQVTGLLNADIVQDLKQLNLNVVPRIYNWLAEVSGEAYFRRRRALFEYPIKLLATVSPLVLNTIPACELPDVNLEPNLARSRLITEGIDQGIPIEVLLSKYLFVPDYLLRCIKDKHHWQVQKDKQPFSYSEFKQDIEFNALISRL